MSESITSQEQLDDLKIKALNAFAHSLNVCRQELSQQIVQEEITYRYAIIRAYSKVLLIAREIYTLLVKGYPEGAFSLSRSLHEAAVIINTLLTGASSNNNELLEHFFDAAEIARIQIELTEVKWFIEKDANFKPAQERLDQLTSELEQYKIKYPDHRFKDYWWANANTFHELAESSNFSKNYIYKHVSGNVHFNAYNTLHCIDSSENSILIGETDKGIELPLWFSTLTLYCIAGIIKEQMPDLISSSVLTALEAGHQAASELKVQTIEYNNRQ